MAGVTERVAASIGLALALCASAIWLFEIHSHLTFIADDWALLVTRQGSGVGYFLDPFNENIILGPALFYRSLMDVFGIDSAAPFFAVATVLFLTSAGLLFALLRRRVDDLYALLGALLILFLGAAFEDLLWAFQIGYFGSMAAGLAMLLALEKEDELGDLLACVLLVTAVACSSLGLSFLVAAAVSVAGGRRPRPRRVYVPLVPLVLYFWWWLIWGHTAESSVTAHNVVHLVPFVYDAAAAGVTSLLGLATGDGTESSQPHLIWGRLLLGALVLAIAARIYREKGISRGLGIALALGISFWVSVALVSNPDFGRFPTASRYQYISAVFLLLIAAETVRGYRVPRPGLVIGTLLAAFALHGGIQLLEREYEERWRPTGEAMRATLAGVDMAGANADPSFRIVFPPKPVTTARKYFEVQREYGSPAYSPSQLAGQSESNRASADLTLAQALDLRLGPIAASKTRVASCERISATPGGETGTTLVSGPFLLRPAPGAALEILLRKFAVDFSVALGPLGSAGSTLQIPADSSGRPWALGVVGSGHLQLCT